MEQAFHRFSELFAQLGLPGDPPCLHEFLGTHARLPGNVELADAPFGTPAQADMLRNEIADDADWAEVVDQLNVALREK